MKNFLILGRTTAIYVLGLMLLSWLTGCASSPDWRENHYQNINAGQQCKTLCESGQLNKAIESGCTCTGAKRNNVSNSSSNGNVNNVYIGSGYGNREAQRGDNGASFVDLFKNLYEMERDKRIHSDKVRNGFYSGDKN